MPRVRLAWLVLGATVLARLSLAVVVPLMDTTEARYGEMARKMVESGDWLVPQHDYGVPYLAKPPLAFWFSALGIELLGPGELGPRLLILVAAALFTVAFYRRVGRWVDDTTAMTAAIVMATSLLYFVAAAAVMTDMLLTIAVAVALGAFWERYRGGGARAELVLYVALGLGLLVKGPLAAVLVLAPVAMWSLAMRNVGDVWRRFAWLKGGLLSLAIAAPWYIAAEIRNPGFLDYFIVGEHIERFLVPGWSGDLYGRAHDVPHGGIWLFFLLGALPWGLLAIPWLIKVRARVRARWREQRELVVFFSAGALAPLLLFTFAGNIIFPYALPALPSAALVLAVLVGAQPRTLGRVAAIGGLSIVAVTVGAWLARPYMEAHSQRAVLAAIAERRPAAAPVYYWQTRFFSADYYGRGRAKVLKDPAPLVEALAAGRGFTLVVSDRRLDSLPPDVLARLRRIDEIDATLVFVPVGAAGAQ